LRTYASEPWPEEAFRRAIASFARWHFCPDEIAAKNILREIGADAFARTGLASSEPYGVYLTGNTVIDTLPKAPFRVLVTLHRRENWGDRIKNALLELGHFASGHDGVRVTAIQHPNWGPQGIYPCALAPDVNFIPPQSRESLLLALRASDLVLTDSGGLQEEAAHFGVDCLVLRTCTERVALERAGAVELVDPNSPSTLRSALEARLAKRRCYGTGDASARIAEILERELKGIE
jgi:UDP-N-acetylglucosamine 2-epimerase (non-hydrolysing)